LWEEALALSRKLENKHGLAWSLSDLAGLALYDGAYEQARERCEEGAAIFRELGDRFGVADILGKLAVAVRCQGDYGRAIAIHRERLAIYEQTETEGRGAAPKWVVSQCFLESAAIAAAVGRTARAVRLFGAADALGVFSAADTLRESSSTSMPCRYERLVTACRAALGEAAFAAAWTEGRAMPLGEAIRVTFEE
jgi:hypothetical protein